MTLPTPQEKPTLTANEVSEILGLGRGQTYQALRTGEIPSITIGRRKLIPTAALWKLLNLTEPQAPTD